MNMCEDFAPNVDEIRTGFCITTTHHLTLLFIRGFLTENNMTVIPQPPYFSLFSRLKKN
jgi:hypothetical protein